MLKFEKLLDVDLDLLVQAIPQKNCTSPFIVGAHVEDIAAALVFKLPKVVMTPVKVNLPEYFLITCDDSSMSMSGEVTSDDITNIR